MRVEEKYRYVDKLWTQIESAANRYLLVIVRRLRYSTWKLQMNFILSTCNHIRSNNTKIFFNCWPLDWMNLLWFTEVNKPSRRLERKFIYAVEIKQRLITWALFTTREHRRPWKDERAKQIFTQDNNRDIWYQMNWLSHEDSSLVFNTMRNNFLILLEIMSQLNTGTAPFLSLTVS